MLPNSRRIKARRRLFFPDPPCATRAPASRGYLSLRRSREPLAARRADGLARLPPDAAARSPLRSRCSPGPALLKRAPVRATSPAELLAFLTNSRRAGLPTSALNPLEATAPLRDRLDAAASGQPDQPPSGRDPRMRLLLGHPRRDLDHTQRAGADFLRSGARAGRASLADGHQNHTQRAGVIFYHSRSA